MLQQRITLAILLLLLSAGSMAQTAKEPLSLEEREVQGTRLSWGNTANVAGLALEEYMENGQTEMLGYLSGGNLHRAQEGNARNGITFKTDRYDKITDRFIVWGSFQFDMNREKERAWSDAITTYNSSPYLFASAIPANYDSQFFDFKGKLAHHTTDRLKLGVGIHYLVGDVSRLRDPRTRTYLADYGLSPSVTFQMAPSHTLGATFSYRHRKDKMPNIRTLQESPNFKYYPMIGMENGEEPRLSTGVESGNGILRGFNAFRRQFVSHFLGGELQYGLKKNGLNWLTTVGIEIEQQQVLGDTKRSPGNYTSRSLNGTTQLSIERHNIHHRVYAKATLYTGSANEFIQSLYETRDPATGIVSKKWVTNFTYENQYQVQTTDLEVGYKLTALDATGKGYRWYAGIQAGFSAFSNQYNVPLSYLKVAHAESTLYGGVRLLKRNRHLITLEAKAGYRASLQSDLLLNNTQNDLAQNIWIPDALYYQTNRFIGDADVKYAFPITTKKAALTGYVRCFTHSRIAHSAHYDSWLTHGIAFGIITL